MPQPLKLRQTRFEETEDHGPVFMGAAVTSQPHLRQRGKEITVFELKGQPYVDVPLYKKGKYRHPFSDRPLNFDDKFTKRIMRNHSKKVTDYAEALNFRHTDDRGSLAFLSADDGGWMEDRGDWVHAMGPVTDDESLKILNSRKWRYSSPEFHLAYRSNAVLSSDKEGVILLEDLFENDRNFITQLSQYEEKVMYELIIGGQTIKLEDAEGGFTIGKDVLDGVKTAFDTVQASLTKKETELAALTAQVKELQEKVTPPAPDPVNLESLPKEFRSVFEQMQEQLKLSKQETDRQRDEAAKERRARNLERVAAAVSKARALRQAGKGHPTVFLENIEKALTFSPVGVNGKTVKLESDQPTVEQFQEYVREALLVILETTPPSVQMESTTTPEDNRPGNGGEGPSKEELEAAIADYESRYGGKK
jgi:hypothetical protein